MAHGNKTIPVPVELRSASSRGVLASTEVIYDYLLGKTQEEINQSVGNQDTFNTLKDAPDSYLRNVHYNISDTTESKILEYARTTDTFKKFYQPKPITLQVDGENYNYLHLSINPKNLSQNPHYKTYDIREKTSLDLYNLIPGNKYFYFVTNPLQYDGSFVVGGLNLNTVDILFHFLLLLLF